MTYQLSWFTIWIQRLLFYEQKMLCHLHSLWICAKTYEREKNENEEKTKKIKNLHDLGVLVGFTDGMYKTNKTPN